jgi:hypothetical protein
MSTAIIEVDEFTTPVIVPEAGDDRTAASIVPAFQALTNRTRHAQVALDGFTGADHVWFGQNVFEGDLMMGAGVEAEYSPPRQKKYVVPIGNGSLNKAGFAEYYPLTGWSFYDPAAAVVIPVELPSGSRLDGIEAVVDNQGSASSPVVIELRRITPNFATPANPTLGGVVNISNTTVVSGPASAGNLALTAVADNATSHLEIRLLAGGGDFATSRGKVMGVRLTVTDYGPRNF